MIIKQPCFVDGSHWEVVDWKNFDSRVLAIIWKITQGKYYIDPTCQSFWNGAGALGLPRSVFHFFEPNDISAQVENYLTACEDIGIIVSGKWIAEIEPVLDAEYSPPPSIGGLLKMALGIDNAPKLSHKKMFDLQYPDAHLDINPRARRGISGSSILQSVVTSAQLAAQYKAWLDGVESEVGIKPIIYTSKWMWIHTGFPAWEAEYKLWDAQYPYNPDGQDHPLYVPYGHWLQEWSWQYSASAVLQGVTGFMDVNVFNGTIEEWNENYDGGAVLPVDPPGDEPMNYKITVNPASSVEPNIRSAGGATLIDPPIGKFHKGQVGYGTEILGGIDQAYRCLKVMSGADMIGWIYDLWNWNQTNAIIEEVADIPPAGELPIIHIHQLFSANGYPDKIVDEEWSPNA